MVSWVFMGILQYNFYCFFFHLSSHCFFSCHTMTQPNMAPPHLHLLPSNCSPLSLPPSSLQKQGKKTNKCKWAWMKWLQQNEQVQMSTKEGQTRVKQAWLSSGGLAQMSTDGRGEHGQGWVKCGGVKQVRMSEWGDGYNQTWMHHGHEEVEGVNKGRWGWVKGGGCMNEQVGVWVWVGKGPTPSPFFLVFSTLNHMKPGPGGSVLSIYLLKYVYLNKNNHG